MDEPLEKIVDLAPSSSTESMASHMVSKIKVSPEHLNQVNNVHILTENEKKAPVNAHKSYDSQHTKSPSKNQGTEIAELVAERAELWHDQDGCGYATFCRSTANGISKENWPIISNGFGEWLSHLCYSVLGYVPSNDVIKSAINALSGKARFDGQKHKPFSRIAVDDKGRLWIDICNDCWSAILVSENGWQITNDVPIKFIRSKSMRSLPIPVEGGKISDLWSLVNIPEEDQILILAWILESLRENTPYPLVELSGEQGSAKSTTQKVLRNFIDPNEVALRAAPRKSEDLFIAATNGHLISLENLSKISNEISDALCTISTGGGSATRAHYTNKEESIIKAKNPVIINGIGSIITRPDLLDRSVICSLPTIKGRITETEHAAKFHSLAPGIMGAILDLFVGTMANLSNVQLSAEELPRMADFARLGEAMSIHLGLPPRTFLHKYKQNGKDATRRIADSNPVATACIQFIENSGTYNGTVKGLLDVLNRFMNQRSLERGDYWPKSPRGLGDALRRVAPSLRKIDIECSIETKPRRDGFHCVLKKAITEEAECIEVIL